MSDDATVVFWGAGATASLRMRMTGQQGKFIVDLTGAGAPGRRSLRSRVKRAVGPGVDGRYRRLLRDLLTILGDDAKSADGIHVVSDEQIAAMRRSCAKGASVEHLSERIVALRLTYDWPALQAVMRICPGIRSDDFKINDLFNILDMHAPSGHGFRDQNGDFLDGRRLVGAKAALKMLLHTVLYVDYQTCIADPNALEPYRLFADWLGRRMQQDGSAFSKDFDRTEFIRSDISFVSLNYDPIALWAQFVANRDLNRGSRATMAGRGPLQLYHDMGHFIPSRRIEPNKRPALWYPMNEASAQRLNETGPAGGSRIRLTKFLFPHGCLCWRECPDCGKLSAYHGDEWDLWSESLIPAPPLKGFDRRKEYPNLGKLHPVDKKHRKTERRLWKDGVVDARACLHCGTITTTQHSQTVMQSSFKQTPPSFIDEIQRDLRALVMGANHIVLMGYSLPPDDVSYRSFFAARQQRADGTKPVKCTIVDHKPGREGPLGPSDLIPDDFKPGSAVRSAQEIFGRENVRFFGAGVPAVFCDAAGHVSDAQLETLFNWSDPSK
ncbi:hypothetical protein [Sphingomonas sp. CFBP 13706]|uniref:hypothetical protein n=1 Tax=Sphingomonas sp. CFBP 13706 TaxID=2775314 RepID=UPI00177B8D38|nr:hypothetical protein [Sphingomonas sp. CFBP 13706]MBD8736216.1 hypothetical protein [Sphingomonas sp. CFBP 13706]